MKKGEITRDSNPNGAIDNIAGILNENQNVLGMMPHPERAAEKNVLSQDGQEIFASIEKFLT